MRIGLYFGSFNPVHIGHLIIASFIANNTDVDQVWFIISPHNPLKKTSTLLNEYHRLHLVQLAINNDNQLKASNIEFKLPRPSYTIDTLTYLTEMYPTHSFTVIMGSDSFQNITRWKNYEQLLNNYHICIYERPGFKVGKETNKLHVLKSPLLEISSTYIREAVKAGKTIRYLVPDAVLEEIERNGYYKI
ncbi:MAG: nicotinate (nicotinamide) nucleotide adenylyltransferase [Bacteroidota bacterium]|nr:nicotinate (nicotinamide) nucleotide adenylyltransferase [Bacteroidota bacterium]